jgi:hypothetical protein
VSPVAASHANGTGSAAAHGPSGPNGATAPVAPASPHAPPRPVLRPRVSDSDVGLAARAFHALDERNMKPLGQQADAAGTLPPAPHGPPAPVTTPVAAPVTSNHPDPWDDEMAPAPADAPAMRRVRLFEDAPRVNTRDTMPRDGRDGREPTREQAVPATVRPAAAYMAPARGGASAALALPVEAEPFSPAAGVPNLEVAEVVAARGATFCRVVIEVDGERYTGVAEVPDQETGGDPATLQVVARITADALRSARVPREPTQFHGAVTVDVAGKPFVVAVLRCWNGRSFDDLSAVVAVTDSPEEAAARAVLRAAASRNT